MQRNNGGKIMGRYAKLIDDLDKLSNSKGVLKALDEVFNLNEGIILNAMSVIENDNHVEEDDYSAFNLVLNGVFSLQGHTKEEIAEAIKMCGARSVSELFEKCTVEDSKRVLTAEEYLESIVPRVNASGYNFAIYNDGILESSRQYTMYDLLHENVWYFNRLQDFKKLLLGFREVWSKYWQICSVVYGDFARSATPEFLAKCRAIIPVIDNEIECNEFMNDFFVRLKALEVCSELAKDVFKTKEILQVVLQVSPIKGSFFSYTKLFSPKMRVTDSLFQELPIAILSFGN